jgi:hypothetical protein
VPSWDVNASKVITTPAQTATITFGVKPTSISAETFNDTGGLTTTAVATVAATVYSLPIHDNVTLVTITP